MKTYIETWHGLCESILSFASLRDEFNTNAYQG